MMLKNIESVEKLRGLARARTQDYETKTVHPKLMDEEAAKGWSVLKKNKKSVRLKRAKPAWKNLEDRVWSLLYRMKFSEMSADGGATIATVAKEPEGPESQIDVVAIDDEIVLVVECKASEKPSKRSQFQEELSRLFVLRDSLIRAVKEQYPTDTKRQTVLAFFLSNVLLSDNDRIRANDANILLFDDKDLEYYETLVAHVGPAAKYQLLADMLQGKSIPGLEIRVPAVRTKMGGAICYTFSITPEYLLKISYVSHRSKGKASDVNTYQRMLNRAKLNTIRQYISDDGTFPTNIVVNLDKKRLLFERVQQKGGVDQDAGVLGWLDIRPSYKSAWIIDGQHRLYAYSGHDRAATSRLAVLAFEGLQPGEQARMFIDINAKQKSVKQSLLQELYAELHWDAEEPIDRIRAIVSKAIQDLDADSTSPFYQRIQTSDGLKDEKRCITITGMFGAIEKTELFVTKIKQGHVVEYGPLWAGDNNKTLKRTIFLLKHWFNMIRTAAAEWWEIGSGDGGGLAMNDSVSSCISVLRSVFHYLDSSGAKLVQLDDEDLVDVIRPFGDALGKYLGSLLVEERKRFRDLRGIQGQTTRTRRCQKAIREQLPHFNPPGLEEFLKAEKAQTNQKAKEVIDRIEKALQEIIMQELRQEYGAGEAQWWMLGVPKAVRLKVTERFEEDDGKRGGKEYYFDIVDYQKIVLNNWEQFEPLLAYGKGGSKEKRLSWLNFINEKRKIVAHASSAVSLSVEDLGQLEQYEDWMIGQFLDNHSLTDAKSVSAGSS